VARAVALAVALAIASGVAFASQKNTLRWGGCVNEI
jgi:hypothetical protein